MADKKAKDAAAEADVPEDIKESQAAEETATADDTAPTAEAPDEEPIEAERDALGLFLMVPAFGCSGRSDGSGGSGRSDCTEE